MALAPRFTVCSFNLWEEARKDLRKEPLTKFLELHRPDILCAQEIRPWTRDLCDEVLKGHSRVQDPFEGWLREGNIYWNGDLFGLQEFGAEDIGIHEKLRKLFWVRLRYKAEKDRTLFVSTCHYTWNGNPGEAKDGLNPRLTMARNTVAALKKLTKGGEAVLFMGDLNDSNHPIKILREGGLNDIFSALGRTPVATFPAEPVYANPPECIDWMLFQGPLFPMTLDVVNFHVNHIPPSDHKPVLATFCFLP